jgi:hypothetical protein
VGREPPFADVTGGVEVGSSLDTGVLSVLVM